MIIPVLKKACSNLGLKYQAIDSSGVFLRIDLGGGRFHLCIANNLGLNDEVTEKICRDKAYTYNLLSESVRMPHTESYVDSQSPALYESFSSFDSHEKIVADILLHNTVPLILKPNGKSMGVHVFFCSTKEAVTDAVSKIFNRDSYNYDHVLLVQEPIEIKSEYRVLVYDGEIQFLYRKDNTGCDVEFTGNLSPLHFANARAVLIDPKEDSELFEEITHFIKPIFEQMHLKYAGLDIARDTKGELCLFEINSKPGFTYFIKDNGETKVIQMFQKILGDLV